LITSLAVRCSGLAYAAGRYSREQLSENCLKEQDGRMRRARAALLMLAALSFICPAVPAYAQDQVI